MDRPSQNRDTLRHASARSQCESEIVGVSAKGLKLLWRCPTLRSDYNGKG
ncbi:unnamed protein product [Penicillium camemberti]|uniref:Str. FM013 n=1 Tax=Penicillium camemberti (strain FM 013) TaxID=1429867 RepID=A0A0G4NVN5_PENC3|nr:unnamed protein product [Penicillium camemberti]